MALWNSAKNKGLTPPEIPRIQMSRATFESQSYRHRHFKDFNGHGSKFQNCDFSYSIFERAYFHSATFENCTFTGCRFYECNFRSATLIKCNLKYSLFYRSIVEVNEICASLPLEPNIRRDLLQNLRANSAAVGNHKDQRLFVLREIEAYQDYWRYAMRAETGYYKEKFPALFDRARAAAHLVGLKMGGWIWGHGEKPALILRSGLTIVFILSLINIWGVAPTKTWDEMGSGLYVLKYSIDVFLGFKSDETMRGFKLIDYLLVIARFAYIGLFISVLLKSVSHR